MYSWLASGRKKGEGASFGQSPSAPPEVKGRLNFSAVESPRPPTRLAVDRPVSLSPASGRLGEYHRSKQNPDVLDQYLSPRTTSRLPQTLYKSSPALHTINSQRFNMFSSPQLMTGSPLSSSRRALTQLRSSHLSARTDQRASPFGTSLVSMAVRSRLHQTQPLNSGVSPVIVHLANVPPSRASSSAKSSEGQGEVPFDPCDKDVIISALKQKRKRWVCHSDDITSITDSQPAAKRSRHTTYQGGPPSLPSSPAFTRPSLHSRKRELTSSSANSSSYPLPSQSLKKPRVLRPPSPLPQRPSVLPATELDEMVEEQSELEVKKVKHHVTMPETGQPREHVPVRPGFGSGSSFGRSSLKLNIPDSEYDSDSESVRCALGVGGVKGDGVEESSVDSGRGSRGSTPPVQEEEEEEGREEERIRRNKAELQRLHKSLTTVFPSLHKTTSRRKVPVFCATGSVPLQPPVLSTTRSVTQEDWRKEREAARAKLRSYLAADDEPLNQPTTLTSVVTSTSSSPQVMVSTAPLTTAPATTTEAAATAAPLTTAPATTTEAAATAAPLTTTPATTTEAAATTAPLTTTPATATKAAATSAPLTTTPATLPVATSQTTVASGLANSATKTASKPQPVSKSVTFQLPNIATSSQSMTSSATPTSQTTSVAQSGTGTGTGLALGTGFKLGSKLASSPPTATLTAPPLSLPPPSSLTATTSTGSGFSLSGGGLAFPTTGLALSSTNTQQQQTASLSQQQQTALLSQQLNQQQPPPTLGVSAALVNSRLLQTTTNSTTSQLSFASTGTANSLPSAALFTNSAAQLGPTSLPSLQWPTISASSTQPTLPKFNFAPVGSGAGNIAAPTLSMSGGFRLGNSGVQTSVSSSGTVSGFSLLSQTSSSGQTLGVQLATSAPMQNSTTGGIFKLGETPTAVTSTTASGGPTFNFSAGGAGGGVMGGGGGGGFNFPSAGPVQQPQQKPIFGGGLQQTQNPAGGLTLGGSGGIFGTLSTTTSTSTAAPSFNFSTLSSTAAGGSQSQNLSGGIFGKSSLQQPPPPAVAKPTNTPTFNFNSSTALPAQQQQQQQQMTNNNMFNFSGPPKEQSSGASVQFGGGGSSVAGTGSMFNFSGSAGQAGSTLGASGSSTGLKFGAGPLAQGAGNVGFNFSAGSNPTTGGLNFGNPMATPGNQTSSTPATGVFGSQMPTGGMFGQTNNSSAGGGGSGTLFNPSQTTPSNPAPQQPFGGFNFTPQPSSTSGFNFTGTPGGNFGSPGVVSGTLFSAGTPTESSRPLATARRRRGRRK